MRSMKLVLTMAVLALALLPADADAQRRPARCCGNPWSFSPYAGAFKDAFDISPDGDETGWMVGFRVGYALGSRTRITANVGYAESDDVTSGPILPDRVVYDNQYIVTTGGAEYDILPGNTSVSLGTELGGAWRTVALDDDNVNPPIGGSNDGYSFYFAVVPSLTIRHGFSSRTALELGLRDFIFPEDNVEHAPALTVGFRFR
jgi:hypothetical protein